MASSIQGPYTQHEGGELRIVGDGVQYFWDAILGIATGVDTVPQNTLKGKCVN